MHPIGSIYRRNHLLLEIGVWGSLSWMISWHDDLLDQIVIFMYQFLPSRDIFLNRLQNSREHRWFHPMPLNGFIRRIDVSFFITNFRVVWRGLVLCHGDPIHGLCSLYCSLLTSRIFHCKRRSCRWRWCCTRKLQLFSCNFILLRPGFLDF